MNQIKTSQVILAREALIEKVKVEKAAVENMLACGERDFVVLRKTLNRYIDFLTAADALGYGAEIIEPDGHV